MTRKVKFVFGLLLLGAALTWMTKAVAQRRTQVKTTVQVEVVEPVGTYGKIDWTGGVIKAVGLGRYPRGMTRDEGKPLARLAAIRDAERHLLETIRGVRINSETVVRMLEVVSDEIRTNIEGILKGHRILAERDLGANYEVTVGVNMGGDEGLVEAVVPEIPDVIEENPELKEKLEPESPPIVEPPKPTPPKVKPTPPNVEADFTGLVVDCNGLGLKPAMSPKIRNEDGKEVWGTVQVSEDYVLKHGIVGYARDPKHPSVTQRVGKNPLFIRAKAVAGGAFKCDPVISNEDADRLKAENEKTRFLDQFKVVFIL